MDSKVSPGFCWPQQASPATYNSQPCLGEIGGTRATRSRSSKYSSCTILCHSSHQSIWALLCFWLQKRINEVSSDAGHFSFDQDFFGLFAGSCFLGGEKGWSRVFFFVKHSMIPSAVSISCFKFAVWSHFTVDSVKQSRSFEPLSFGWSFDPGEDCERLICNECARPLAKERLAWGVAGAKGVGCTWFVPWLSGTYFYLWWG